MHYERVSLARRGGSWRMSYRAVYDAEHKGDRKWATIGAARRRADRGPLAIALVLGIVDRAVAHPP